MYSRNEYCHELDKKNFKGLVMEATGESHDSKVVEFIVSTFFNAKSMADFEAKPSETEPEENVVKKTTGAEVEKTESKKVHLGLNYTINLVLPKTDDPSVYNAIFQSLRENLLKG